MLTQGHRLDNDLTAGGTHTVSVVGVDGDYNRSEPITAVYSADLIAPSFTLSGNYQLWVIAEDAASNVSRAGPYSLTVTALEQVYLPVVVRGE